MTSDELRALQAPIKSRYREQPESARATLRAEGQLDADALACRVQTAAGMVASGLHPMAGGDGSWACAAELLLQALVACAGVTLRTVATALNIPIRGGQIRAEGDLDFRGTLGVEKTVPAGFSEIRLHIEVDSDAAPEPLRKLVELTERYCVVLQSLRTPPALSASIETIAR
jgi:uncharacterized OsmC-like protein